MILKQRNWHTNMCSRISHLHEKKDKQLRETLPTALRPICLFVGTVNSEIFARILFSIVALKHIFAMSKMRDKGVIYLCQ